MQDHSHHVQELHEVGFFLILGRSVSLHSCAWCSVRSSLHTSGAHLTTPFHGAIAVGAMLPPTPPSNIFPCRTACILRMFLYLCR